MPGGLFAVFDVRDVASETAMNCRAFIANEDASVDRRPDRIGGRALRTDFTA